MNTHGVEIRTQITGISSFLLLGKYQGPSSHSRPWWQAPDPQNHLPSPIFPPPNAARIVSLLSVPLWSLQRSTSLLPPSRMFSCSDDLTSSPFCPNSSDCHQITPRLGSVLPCPHEYLWEFESASHSSSPLLRLFLVSIFSLSSSTPQSTLRPDFGVQFKNYPDRTSWGFLEP